jgi:plastocyanin
MSEYTIAIEKNRFRPRSMRIQAGDTVVWENRDPHDHFIYSSSQRVQFSTGLVKTGTRSRPVEFPSATSYGGTEISCLYYGSMEGLLFVSPTDKTKIKTSPAALAATTSNAEPGATYSVETWRVIARIVVGHWIYDMADNFGYGKNLYRGDSLIKLNTEWCAIESFWQQQTGTTKTILDSNNNVDQSAFIDESRDKLEALGRRIRGVRRKLRAAGVVLPQYPYPARPDEPDVVTFGLLYGGQSDDPFGEAIGVNYSGLKLSPNDGGILLTEVQHAEIRHEDYALDPLWTIESKQDAGEEISDEDKENYKTKRMALTIDDFHILAAHLYFGLSKLFKSSTFPEDQFAVGIRRMTVHGEWDGSWQPMWHWLRWIDGYIVVKETGQLPNPLGELIT